MESSNSLLHVGDLEILKLNVIFSVSTYFCSYKIIALWNHVGHTLYAISLFINVMSIYEWMSPMSWNFTSNSVCVFNLQNKAGFKCSLVYSDKVAFHFVTFVYSLWKFMTGLKVSINNTLPKNIFQKCIRFVEWSKPFKINALYTFYPWNVDATVKLGVLQLKKTAQKL